MAAMFLALHVIGAVGYVFLIRRSSLKGVSPYLLATFMQLSIIAVSYSLWALGIFSVTFELSTGRYAALALNGVTAGILQTISIVALSKLESSEYTILINLRLILVTILSAVFLSQTPPTLQIIGGLLIFAAIIALSLKKGGWHWRPVQWWGVGVGAFMSVHATLEKYNIDAVGFETYMVIVGPVATAMVLAIAIKQGVIRSDINKLFSRDVLGPMLFRTMMVWGYVIGVSMVQVAVAGYISGLSVVGSVLAGVILLNERERLPQKITATALAVAGLTLILIGNL